MRIVDIREKTASIASPIANAYIDFSKMTCSVVAVVTDVIRDGKPVVGYGFNSNGRYGQGALMRDRFLARVLEADPASLIDEANDNLDPFAIWAALMQYADDKVWVYAAGGYYYPGKDDEKLKAEMRSYLDRGYDVVKMKIGAVPLAEDLRRIESVLEVVGEGRRLAVDANGRFDAETAIAYAKALKPYGLFWYEEAGDPLDYAIQAELAEHYDGAMATGENLFSHQDARNLLRYGGMRSDLDYLQFDCALSYGLVEYLKTLEVMEALGWSSRRVVPHGGHQMSLNIAAGLHLGGNESYPDVFQPFGGFADGIAVENSYVALPQIPGVGFEAKSKLYAVMRELAE